MFHHSLGEYLQRGKPSVLRAHKRVGVNTSRRARQLKTWPWKELQRDPEYLRVEVEVQSDFMPLKVAAWDKHCHLTIQIPVPFLYKAKDERRESKDNVPAAGA